MRKSSSHGPHWGWRYPLLFAIQIGIPSLHGGRLRRLLILGASRMRILCGTLDQSSGWALQSTSTILRIRYITSGTPYCLLKARHMNSVWLHPPSSRFTVNMRIIWSLEDILSPQNLRSRDSWNHLQTFSSWCRVWPRHSTRPRTTGVKEISSRRRVKEVVTCVCCYWVSAAVGPLLVVCYLRLQPPVSHPASSIAPSKMMMRQPQLKELRKAYRKVPWDIVIFSEDNPMAASTLASCDVTRLSSLLGDRYCHRICNREALNGNAYILRVTFLVP